MSKSPGKESALVYLAAFASCYAQYAVSVLEDLPKLNCVGVTDKIVSCLYDSLCLLLCNVSARGTEHFPNMGCWYDRQHSAGLPLLAAEPDTLCLTCCASSTGSVSHAKDELSYTTVIFTSARYYPKSSYAIVEQVPKDEQK